MSRVAKEFQESFGQASNQQYKDQACFFMNAFWSTVGSNAESVWDFVLRFQKLDPLASGGNSLDEWSAHKFLEELGETLTAVCSIFCSHEIMPSRLNLGIVFVKSM